MACRGCWGNEILLSLVLFLIVLSFCHGTRLTKRKALDKARGNSKVSHGENEPSELHPGELLIGQNPLQGAGVKSAEDSENLLEIGTGYQADMGWGESKQPDGRDHDLSRQRRDYAAVKHLLQMDPKVECTGNSMKLQVQDAASTPGSLLFVDRGSRLSPLPLSHLPASCGYSIRSTPRDLVLVAPYDGCFVALEEDTYVLPLRWGGLPVKMSCPLMKQSSPNPPIVTCHAEGMVVKMDSTTSVADIKVKLTGDWEPLMTASPRCGFSIVAHPEGVVISVHYAPCLKKKDGMYTLELAGDGDAKISCPSMSPAETTKNPVNYPTQQTGAPTPAFEPPQTEAPQTPAETPTAGPKLEAPQGQKYHPFYHYLYPQPEYDNKPATKPQRPPQPQDQVHQIFHTQPESEKTTAPKPSQPEVYQPFNPYYQLMSTVPPKPQKPEVPWDQVHQPFSLNAPPVQPQPEDPQEHVLHPVYYPFDSQPENEPSAPLEPPKPQVSQGQVQQVFPWKPAERPTAAPVQPQREDPRGRMLHPVYCPLQSNPENKPATKPTAPQEPPKPEVDQDQVHQSFFLEAPFYNYPQPEPTAPQEPPKPEVPQGQVYQQFPMPPAERPTAAPAQPQSEDPQGQMLLPFYYNTPKPATNPTVSHGQVYQPFSPKPAGRPTAAPPQPQPEDPQSPVYCPKSCPSGLSNCCVQIAFHQHLHHIVPAKETGQVYTGLPFLPSGVYSGFDQGLGFPPLPQMPTTTSTSAPVHSPPIPCKNRKQPPDSNPDAMSGSNPSNPTYQQPSYPYVVPNPMPQWPNEYLQTLPGHYSGSSQPQIQSNQVQHGQPSAEEQNKPLQSNSNSMDSEELRHNQAQHEPYNYLVPHYLQ
ncbi:uncharacterized protein [Labrus bergylta]|uniref:uncharacterized protein n=1 Tax=Labrus bergylta TaxID=56723 RepID=UPI0009B338AC|nr:pollen-specific leucine-rich repeat extensin-like protein 1 [Labrus bergylta]